MDARDIPSQLRPILEPPIGRLGFDLVAVEWMTGQRGPLLRVSIDRVNGVSAANCAEVSRYISPILDQVDFWGGRYDLEVSSPGIERPVQRLADFERFKGYKARIRLREGFPRRRYSGRIERVEDDDIVVEVDGAEHRIPFDAIERTHLILDLEEYKALSPEPPPAAEEEALDDQ